MTPQTYQTKAGPFIETAIGCLSEMTRKVWNKRPLIFGSTQIKTVDLGWPEVPRHSDESRTIHLVSVQNAE